MWNRMKRWLHHVLQEDTSTEDELYDSSHSVGGSKPKNEFQTKMVYQYPKQGEFRFPIIPDERKNMKRTRSNESNQHQEAGHHKQRDTYMRKEQSDSVKTQYKVSDDDSNQKSSIHHKEQKEDVPYPFVPSDVPSPIYGFGSRSEQDENALSLEDIPAFLRKQNESSDVSKQTHTTTDDTPPEIHSGEPQVGSSIEVKSKESDDEPENIVPFLRTQETEHYEMNEEQTESYDEPLEDQQESSDIHDMDQHEEEEQEEQEEENSAFIDFDHDESSQKSFENFQQEVNDDVKTQNEPIVEEKVDADTIFEEQPTEVDSPSEERFDEHQEARQEEVQQADPEAQRSPEKSRRPFNVIMTPRDKRNRDLKTSHQKEQELEETAVDVDESDIGEEAEEPTLSVEAKDTTPPLHMLDDPIARNENDDAWIEDQMQLLETTLQHFHVKAKVVNAMKGPAVTRFEVQPEPGVKVSKITNLADDIKLSLAAKDIRMEAPIPGKNAIGIEVPNQQAQAVSLQEILESPSFKENDSPLSVGLGLDIAGSPVITDLKKMPHGLIAGATGSGKSVSINTILISLLYKAHYEDVKFLLIDPKMVELAPYNDLPHLVAPVITDVKAATSALKWAVKEMEERYEKFVAEGVRDIDRYNEKMKAKGRTAEKMPYMVIVIDELADLMMVSPQDVEDAICRIAQKARACGMHLLLATQRPSVDVITGLIKANIPTRVAFSVSSQVDSRTIIDTNGAEKLLGKGDMLLLENGSGKGQRIQGAFVSDDEIERIASYVKKVAPPNYMFEQDELIKQTNFEEEEDDLFEEAVDFVINQNGASASLLQRRFKVGYNRAARLIDTMEEKGIISAAKGSKPREVYMTHASFEEYLTRNKE